MQFRKSQRERERRGVGVAREGERGVEIGSEARSGAIEVGAVASPQNQL